MCRTPESEAQIYAFLKSEQGRSSPAQATPLVAIAPAGMPAKIDMSVIGPCGNRCATCKSGGNALSL